MSSQPNILEFGAGFAPRPRVSNWFTQPRPNTYAIVFSLCVVLGLITSLECATWSKAAGITPVPDLGALVYPAVLWLWWGCVASIVWYQSGKHPLIASFNAHVISAHLAVACVLGVAHLLLLGSVGFVNPDWRAQNTATEVWTGLLHLNRFGIEVLLYGFIFGITGVAQHQIRGQRDAMRALELQHQLSEAHLRAFRRSWSRISCSTR